MSNYFTRSIVTALKDRLPLNIAAMMDLAGKKVGLVIVDEVDGFCEPGCGPLAPPVEDPMVEKMIANTNALAKAAAEIGLPILVLQEAHTEDHPEEPYPPHCIVGSGHELLVDELKWIYGYPETVVVRKSCLNGVIGAINVHETGPLYTRLSNSVFEWIKKNDLGVIVVVGICTDICVLQFVQAMLSARNRDLVPPLKDVVVYTEGCATYDLPVEVAEQIGLPKHLAHDQEISHYMGLYLMQMSGAILAENTKL